VGSDASQGSHAILEQGELDVVSLLHGLFLSYVQVSASIVPVNRFRSLVGLMRDSLYKVTGVSTMGLITIHSVEKTLDNYCALLEASGVAEKATAVMEAPQSFRFNVRGCMFGGDCRRLVSGTYICPFAMFAGFLAQESSGGKVSIEPSEKTMLGSRTLVVVGSPGSQMRKTNVYV
jgi:hypothetical protein